MRLITKKQEREILKRIWANHIIAMAEIDDAESLMHYLDNEADTPGGIIIDTALPCTGIFIT